MEEFGKQGDALAPALFSLGQHDGLERAAAELQAGEELLAYLDDLYVITVSRRAREGLDLVASRVQEHCGVASNVGKTRVYNAGHGAPPPGVHELGDEVWRGSRPSGECGFTALGVPLADPDYVGADVCRMNRHFWTTCRAVRTCNARGSCCSCAAARGPTTLCATSRQTWCSLMRRRATAQSAQPCKPAWEKRPAAATCSLPRPGRLPRSWKPCGLQSAAYWGAWADCLGYLSSRCPNLARACTDALARGGIGRPAMCAAQLRPICCGTRVGAIAQLGLLSLTTCLRPALRGKLGPVTG